jgi:hypothetical protein
MGLSLQAGMLADLVHYLRRVTAHLDLRGALPAPGDDKATAHLRPR